ncbi:MAG TPA: gliding motility lipoprotein GldH [Bacteroidia bacterium]|nr:gliding motility lipoprotein GldH [Bacteroidia bacterium]
MCKNRPFFVLLCCITVVFCSCNKGVMYQKYVSIPDNTWVANKPITFTVPVDDTINYYNVYVNIRQANDYDFGNIYLFIDITAPGNHTERDTMNCVLADNSGRWLGQGLGDIWDNKLWFKRHTRFHKGEYKFTYTQAMRVDTLEQIMDVGLRVEKEQAQN